MGHLLAPVDAGLEKCSQRWDVVLEIRPRFPDLMVVVDIVVLKKTIQPVVLRERYVRTGSLGEAGVEIRRRAIENPSKIVHAHRKDAALVAAAIVDVGAAEEAAIVNV